MVKRALKQEGGDADPVEEVRSEERDATEPGASSHERKAGGSVPHGMHEMQKTPHHRMKQHGNIHRADGGEVPEGSESLPQEKKHGGRMKRAKGGAVHGKVAKAHPGRRARGGAADLNPYTSAGKMSEPDYQRAQPGPSAGGRGADTEGGLRTLRG